MNELSLFTGAGGGVLASKLLGHRVIGYVEYESYCQKVLRQRIADGILDAAPIYRDIRKFNSEGYAEQYRGMVDVIAGGPPCQPFSVAGKRKSADDERNMWPAFVESIRIIQPRYAFIENVPGLLTATDGNFTEPDVGFWSKTTVLRYFGVILRDLAEIGYDAEWTMLGADDCGAPHRRKRLWILAHAQERDRGLLLQPGG